MSGSIQRITPHKTTLLRSAAVENSAADKTVARPHQPAALGNQAAQFRLRLNPPQPHDAYEQEADQIAQQAVSMPDRQVQQLATQSQSAPVKPLAETITPFIQRQTETVPEDAEEEEPVQTKRLPTQRQAEVAPEDEEEEPVQAKRLAIQRQAEAAPEDEEEEPVQAKRFPTQRQAEVAPEDEEEEKPIQAKGTSTSPDVSPELAGRIQRMQSGGHPLEVGARDYFEPRFGADFGGVRIHDDAAAAQTSRELNAQAFTQGNHIFFGAGQYQPDHTPGRRLLAHELTHTVQQGGSPSAVSPAKGIRQRSPAGEPGLIQRANGTPPPATQQPGEAVAVNDESTDATRFGYDKGKLEGAGTDEARIVFDKIGVPGFKTLAHRSAEYASFHPLRRTKNFRRGNPDQRTLWRDSIAPADIISRLQQKAGPHDPQARNYVFKLSARNRRQPFYYFGSLNDIARQLLTPVWGGRDARPEFKNFHVDHIVELQLGNWNGSSGPANSLANMELLEARKNMASGRELRDAIVAKVQKFNQDTANRYGASVNAIKRNYHLDFLGAEVGAGDRAITRQDYWKAEEIQRGDHLNALQPSNLADLGGSGQVRIFPGAQGGQSKGFAWPNPDLSPSERNWLKPFEITGKQFITENEDGSPGVEANPNFGQFDVRLPETSVWHAADNLPPVTIARAPGACYAGAINKQSVLVNLRGRRVKKASPIQVNSFDITDQGLQAAGKIVTDIPLLRGADIDFSLENGELVLSKTFDIGEFNVPRPLEINNSELTLFAGTERGAGLGGRVDFRINRVGEGNLEGRASAAGGFALAGSFNFDSNLFTPAHITMRYENNQFSGEGQLGIPSGRVRGIRSANFRMVYAENRLSATGAAQFTTPGIREAGLSLEYSEQDGLTIGGALTLADNIPGIRSGSIEARVIRKPDGQYKVYASGRAMPAISGIDSELTVTYDDGALVVIGTAYYRRGMLSGSLTVGAANSPIGQDNRPGGEPDGRLRAFGGGRVTVQIAPWLQGTVGVRLLLNGELELSGEIGLPSALDIFPAKRLQKNIFTLNLDIPIVGVAVAGQRIGIFATVGGGLDVRAGIGPGQLRDLSLGITYNPDHELDTRVTGRAQLHIPAEAGLRLFVRGGLGVGIPIVSATAGLEVSGELGIQGAVQANVNVDWTPRRGLVLDAQAEAFAEPVLRLDVSAFVDVSANLLVTTLELYHHRWRLAGVEYGSGLRFGISLPIHYEEGRPFDISLDDVQFTVPRINARDVISNVLDSNR